MVSVSPLTNAVSDNIDKTIADLGAGNSPAAAITRLLDRDVRAMVHGGPEQGLHFVDAAGAWFIEPKESVVTTYEEMHAAYREGWLRIVEAAARQFIDDEDLDTLVLHHSAAAEEAALQAKNGAWEELDIVRRLAKPLATFFMAVTEPKQR